MHTRTLGTSRQGRAIVEHSRGAAGGLLVFGAIHGDEPGSALLCERFLTRVMQADAEGPSLSIVPVLNPDGLARNHKDNASGVDLNRSFAARSWTREHPLPYFPGSQPGSEPETQALTQLVEARRPSLIVAVHQPFECVNWDGPAADAACAMSVRTGMPLRPSIGYPTPGSFGSWAGVDRGIAVITLELPWTPDEGLLARCVFAFEEAWRRS
ncbi:MAG: M14 family zinc carboxypeptidase [Polyangia bacterium]